MNEKDNCEHDWRINPNKILPSNPPRRQVICLKCGYVSSIGTVRFAVDKNDMTTWERYIEK